MCSNDIVSLSHYFEKKIEAMLLVVILKVLTVNLVAGRYGEQLISLVLKFNDETYSFIVYFTTRRRNGRLLFHLLDEREGTCCMLQRR
jgi:hypothetical protein